MKPLIEERFKGCLLGLAVGDALGTAVESKPRGSFPPVTDMIGGGPFNLEAGQWTDDTSMALCLAESLTEQKGFDPKDQMERYIRWYREGHLSSTGECFDIGNATRAALHRFEKSSETFAGSPDPRSAGNGSIMRLAPVPLFCYPDVDMSIRLAGESSGTTHAAPECIEACQLFALILVKALDGKSKKEILFDPENVNRIELSEKLQKIACGDYADKLEDEIRGTGYVVDSLEAALWCFHHTDSFQDAVLKAVNLGEDADTTAAVCGQIAGAFYGVMGISSEWLERVCMREKLEELATKLFAGTLQVVVKSHLDGKKTTS